MSEHAYTRTSTGVARCFTRSAIIATVRPSVRPSVLGTVLDRLTHDDMTWPPLVETISALERSFPLASRPPTSSGSRKAGRRRDCNTSSMSAMTADRHRFVIYTY